MLVLVVTRNFEDDSIQNERATMETPFPHYRSIWEIIRRSRAANSVVVVRSGRNSNSSEILCMSSLPASTKRIQSKATEKRWRHHFPHYKSMGVFCCNGHEFFLSNLPQNIMQPFPTPSDATHKICSRLANWPQSIQVRKCKIFVIQGQVTPEWVVWSGPKSNSSELLCLSWLLATLMMIQSKNERASMETAFSHYNSMGNFLDAQAQLTQ